MKLSNTPLWWRKDWSLYRAQQTTDRNGDPVRSYDMDAPDFTGSAKTASGVAWHITSRRETVQEYGEEAASAASFLLDLELEIAAFDRCVFGGRLWEVRGVLERSGFRCIHLVEVDKWASS